MTKEMGAMGIDDRTTSFGRKRGCTISHCGLIGLGLCFIGGVVLTGLLVYHFAPCVDSNGSQSFRFGDDTRRPFKGKDTKEKIDVRLPRSVLPDSYEIKLVPFIWPGNFTFNGEVWLIFFFFSKFFSSIL